MIYTTTTSTSIDIVKQEIEAKAKAMGFGLLNSYEFKKILESKGFPIERDITVYEVCNPSGAQDALSHLPEISVYLPCRLSLYEENGKTTFATIGFENILDSVDVDSDFKAHMSTIFENLKQIMHSWDEQKV